MPTLNAYKCIPWGGWVKKLAIRCIGTKWMAPYENEIKKMNPSPNA